MPRAAIVKRNDKRARELRDALKALRREQGLIIAELVWNEMRAWEIKGLLDAPEEPEDRTDLEKDLHRRCNLVRSLAQWERKADQSYRRQHLRLKELFESDPDACANLEGLSELMARKGLESIARAAADDLELDLDGGVDGA